MNNNISPISPSPTPKKSGSNSLFIIGFLIVLAGLTFGVYHYSSKYFDDGTNSNSSKISALTSNKTSSGTSSGKIASDDERAQAFASLFGTAADLGQEIAPLALGMGMGGMGMGPGGMPDGFPEAGLNEGFNEGLNENGSPENFPSFPSDDTQDTQATNEIPPSDNSDAQNNEQGTVVQQLRTEYAYVQMGDPSLSLGASVIRDITSDSADGSTVSHPEMFTSMAMGEFKDAKLTKAELSTLGGLNINLDINKGESLSGEDSNTLTKLIKLVYYGKKLDKGPSIAVLIESLHPSIQRALLENQDLAIDGVNIKTPPQGSAPEPQGQNGNEEAAQNTEQNTEQNTDQKPSADSTADELSNALKDVENQAKQALLDSGVVPSRPSVDAASVEVRFNEGRGAANSGNFAKALRIWLPLAEGGHAGSQTALGRLYARGDGVSQNLSEARHWFELAAQQGDTKAQLNLGKMYLRGDGGPKDLTQAKQYLGMAAQSGNDEAETLLKSFGKGIR